MDSLSLDKEKEVPAGRNFLQEIVDSANSEGVAFVLPKKEALLINKASVLNNEDFVGRDFCISVLVHDQHISVLDITCYSNLLERFRHAWICSRTN